MKKIVKIIFVFIIVLVISCKNKHEEKNITKSNNVTLKKVEVALSQLQEVSILKSYPSVIMPYCVNNLSPMVGERIEKINADIGDFVKKGDVLIEGNSLKLNQAELKLQNEEKELIAMRKIFSHGGVSQKVLDVAELSYKVNKKALDELRKNIYIQSPINGVVVEKNFYAGDIYSGSKPVLQVQQIRPIKLLIGVSESDYSKLSKYNSVYIYTDALPGKQFKGKIGKIYPIINPLTHTVNVEIIISNSDRSLRPGMYANVKLDLGSHKNIVVPNLAVVKELGTGNRLVYVVDEQDKIVICKVELGESLGDKYEIISGLKPNMRVVISEQKDLSNNQKVQVLLK